MHDEISRLYYRVHNCEHYFGDNLYWAMALSSMVLLMPGLIMLSNAEWDHVDGLRGFLYITQCPLLVSFALNPTKHVWRHNFEIKEVGS